MENPIKMGDLGVPLFLESPICDHDFWQLRTFGSSSALVPKLHVVRWFPAKSARFPWVYFKGQ